MVPSLFGSAAQWLIWVYLLHGIAEAGSRELFGDQNPVIHCPYIATDENTIKANFFISSLSYCGDKGLFVDSAGARVTGEGFEVRVERSWATTTANPR